MSSQSHEVVVLVLRDVLYRHTKFALLEEFLVEKYGFSRIEEKEHEISGLRKIVPTGLKGMVLEEEIEKKLSSLKIYEGSHLDSKIRIWILGDVIEEEDTIMGAGEEDQQPIYTAEYQMIKLVGQSGYAMQQLIERLVVDLGLGVKSKEWFFHRCGEG